MLRALNHPVRRQILDVLARTDQLNVSQIMDAIELPQASTSQHLAILRRVKLIAARRSGKIVFYKIDRDQLERVSEVIKDLGK